MGKFSKDKRDIFYRLAKERGYRARSAFKLMHLDTEFALFNQRGNALLVNRAVDLCAAPGSWSQVLADKLYSADEDPTKADPPKIIAVDLQPMAPVDGVLCLQGDITSEDTARRIISHFQGQRAELVVCDGAPDVTGLHDIDEFLQGQLLLSAMMITTHVLCPNGTFVAKIFRGKNVDFLYEQLRHLFGRVSIAKPSSSRNSSLESFVVCERFKGAPYLNMPLDIGGYLSVNDIVNGANDQNVEGFGMSPGEVAFFACGDLTGWKPHGVDNNGNDDVLDADKSYPVDQSKDHIAPIAPPIEPPYQTSIEKQKADRQKRS